MTARPACLPAAIAALAVLSSAGPEAAAQGFAGLGTEAEGYALPVPGWTPRFPADHGPHPEFRVEWWYLTANLEDDSGTPLGIQWTLFRFALAPPQAGGDPGPQLWMGHAAVTTAGSHHAAERLARGGTGQAGVTAAPFAAWIDEWIMAGPDLSALRLAASGPDFAYDLALSAQGPIVLHGEAGYSVKSALGQASHYYSQPFYRVEGSVTLPGADAAIGVTGQAWLDREWSSQPLAPDQTGWDWFSIHLGTGEKLMGFRLRSRAGADFTAATWIGPDGTARSFPDGAFRAEPLPEGLTTVAGREIPTAWRVTLAEAGLDLELRALNPRSFMPTSVPYWEGPVSVSGSHAGVGYLEMTGYE